MRVGDSVVRVSARDGDPRDYGHLLEKRGCFTGEEVVTLLSAAS